MLHYSPPPLAFLRRLCVAPFTFNGSMTAVVHWLPLPSSCTNKQLKASENCSAKLLMVLRRAPSGSPEMVIDSSNASVREKFDYKNSTFNVHIKSMHICFISKLASQVTISIFKLTSSFSVTIFK